MRRPLERLQTQFTTPGAQSTASGERVRGGQGRTRGRDQFAGLQSLLQTGVKALGKIELSRSEKRAKAFAEIRAGESPKEHEARVSKEHLRLVKANQGIFPLASNVVAQETLMLAQAKRKADMVKTAVMRDRFIEMTSEKYIINQADGTLNENILDPNRAVDEESEKFLKVAGDITDPGMRAAYIRMLTDFKEEITPGIINAQNAVRDGVNESLWENDMTLLMVERIGAGEYDADDAKAFNTLATDGETSLAAPFSSRDGAGRAVGAAAKILANQGQHTEAAKFIEDALSDDELALKINGHKLNTNAKAVEDLLMLKHQIEENYDDENEAQLEDLKLNNQLFDEEVKKGTLSQTSEVFEAYKKGGSSGAKAAIEGPITEQLQKDYPDQPDKVAAILTQLQKNASDLGGTQISGKLDPAEYMRLSRIVESDPIGGGLVVRDWLENPANIGKLLPEQFKELNDAADAENATDKVLGGLPGYSAHQTVQTTTSSNYAGLSTTKRGELEEEDSEARRDHNEELRWMVQAKVDRKDIMKFMKEGDKKLKADAKARRAAFDAKALESEKELSGFANTGRLTSSLIDTWRDDLTDNQIKQLQTTNRGSQLTIRGAKQDARTQALRRIASLGDTYESGTYNKIKVPMYFADKPEELEAIVEEAVKIAGTAVEEGGSVDVTDINPAILYKTVKLKQDQMALELEGKLSMLTEEFLSQPGDVNLNGLAEFMNTRLLEEAVDAGLGKETSIGKEDANGVAAPDIKEITFNFNDLANSEAPEDYDSPEVLPETDASFKFNAEAEFDVPEEILDVEFNSGVIREYLKSNSRVTTEVSKLQTRKAITTLGGILGSPALSLDDYKARGVPTEVLEAAISAASQTEGGEPSVLPEGLPSFEFGGRTIKEFQVPPYGPPEVREPPSIVPGGSASFKFEDTKVYQSPDGTPPAGGGAPTSRPQTHTISRLRSIELKDGRRPSVAMVNARLNEAFRTIDSVDLSHTASKTNAVGEREMRNRGLRRTYTSLKTLVGNKARTNTAFPLTSDYTADINTGVSKYVELSSKRPGVAERIVNGTHFSREMASSGAVATSAGAVPLNPGLIDFWDVPYALNFDRNEMIAMGVPRDIKGQLEPFVVEVPSKEKGGASRFYKLNDPEEALEYAIDLDTAEWRNIKRMANVLEEDVLEFEEAARRATRMLFDPSARWPETRKGW